jgi:hypothetical protein
MAIYTVHEPSMRRRGRERGPERFRLVRDGFYVWAFLLTPFWLIWHRLWLAFLGYALIIAGATYGMHSVGAPRATVTALGVLLSLLIALEGGTLRRWGLRRRRWRELGVVSAPDRESAERRFFDGWSAHEPASRTQPLFTSGAAGHRAAAQPDVLGLFPEPGTQR